MTIKTLETLGAHTRLFIESLEASGANKIRVDEWAIVYNHKTIKYRFNYAHAEQRIHVKVCGIEVLTVSINLANAPVSFPTPADVQAKALELFKFALDTNLRDSDTVRLPRFVGWDLRGDEGRGVVPDGASVVD